MSKRVDLQLVIGHRDGIDKNITYSRAYVLELLTGSPLPRYVLLAEGTEGGHHPSEDTTVININWNETVHGKVEGLCKHLNDLLGKVADKMRQEWVILKGWGFSGNFMYPIDIALNLEGFGELGTNPQERRSIQPDAFFERQLVFRGTHAEPYVLPEAQSERLRQTPPLYVPPFLLEDHNGRWCAICLRYFKARDHIGAYHPYAWTSPVDHRWPAVGLKKVLGWAVPVHRHCHPRGNEPSGWGWLSQSAPYLLNCGAGTFGEHYVWSRKSSYKHMDSHYTQSCTT